MITARTPRQIDRVSPVLHPPLAVCGTERGGREEGVSGAKEDEWSDRSTRTRRREKKTTAENAARRFTEPLPGCRCGRQGVVEGTPFDPRHKAATRHTHTRALSADACTSQRARNLCVRLSQEEAGPVCASAPFGAHHASSARRARTSSSLLFLALSNLDDKLTHPQSRLKNAPLTQFKREALSSSPRTRAQRTCRSTQHTRPRGDLPPFVPSHVHDQVRTS